MGIEKAAQYRSFYEAAKKIVNQETRLALYDAIDAYRFDGIEPENLPFEADLVFTVIKPIIDADINSKVNGAAGGAARGKKGVKDTPLEKKETPPLQAENKPPLGKPETKDKTDAPACVPEKRRFAKPTVEEIAAYCKERSNGIDAQAFFDFYESKAWKVGKTPMNDWRACVRTWEQRRKFEDGGGKAKAGGMWGAENEVPDEIMEIF